MDTGFNAALSNSVIRILKGPTSVDDDFGFQVVDCLIQLLCDVENSCFAKMCPKFGAKGFSFLGVASGNDDAEPVPGQFPGNSFPEIAIAA
jgi:hypothetical protein